MYRSKMLRPPPPASRYIQKNETKPSIAKRQEISFKIGKVKGLVCKMVLRIALVYGFFEDKNNLYPNFLKS
jgi:hypothetical protein